MSLCLGRRVSATISNLRMFIPNDKMGELSPYIEGLNRQNYLKHDPVLFTPDQGIIILIKPKWCGLDVVLSEKGT